MPITCNAVGDLLALIQLAIKVADTLNEARNAPAECRALLNELRALQSLVELSRPMIGTSDDETLGRLVDDRLYGVAQRILDGLALVVDLDIAQDPAHAAETARSLPRRIKRWARISKQSLRFVLKTNASARECREAISQSFTSLIYALLVVVHDDHRQFIRTVAEAHDKMTTELHRLADATSTGQEQMLRENDAILDAQFKLLRSVEEVQKQVSELGVLERESTTAIRNDITGMATSIESERRTAVNYIIQSQAAIAQDIIGTGANEHAVTRQCHEAATAREHVDTRRYITAAAAAESSRVVAACNFEHVATRLHMRTFIAEGVAATTGATIGAVQSENDETRTQVLASVSGLSLTMRNSVDKDRAQRARIEARLEELVRLLEAVAGVVDLIRRVQLPGFQQQRLGWRPAMLFNDSPATVTSRDVIVGAIVLAFTTQHDHTRLSCAAMAVAFMVWRQVYGVMYQVPKVHMVIVFDLFDNRIGIPLEEALSSQTMHQALARRANMMGRVLIQTKQYEIRIGDTTELLPTTWNDVLRSGSEVWLNARVPKKTNETRAICPTCSIPIKVFGTPSEWSPCPRCSMKVLVSTSDEPEAVLHPPSHDAHSSQELDEDEDEDAGAAEEIGTAPNSNLGSADSPDPHTPSSAPKLNMGFVLKHCKRVHFIAQRMSEAISLPLANGSQEDTQQSPVDLDGSATANLDTPSKRHFTQFRHPTERSSLFVRQSNAIDELPSVKELCAIENELKRFIALTNDRTQTVNRNLDILDRDVRRMRRIKEGEKVGHNQDEDEQRHRSKGSSVRTSHAWARSTGAQI